jgi:cyanophycin synthetase
MNIAADHLGLKDVNTLEDLARVKSVVPRAVSPTGYAVLNAEDELVYSMRELVSGNIVLFSMDEDNKNIQRQARRGRISCVYENGYITILKGKWKVRIERAVNIPVTYGGRAEFMVQNVLAATLAAFVHGVPIEAIRMGLTTFNAGTAQTPGRLNFVEIGDTTLLMDYAHNPAGLRELAKFIGKLPNKYRTVVLNGTGDRRDEDIREFGKVAGEVFDRIVIRRGNYLRGRDEQNMYELLKAGIADSGREPAVRIIPEGADAIRHAVKNARKSELVVTLGDRVVEDIAIVSGLRDEYAGTEGQKGQR